MIMKSSPHGQAFPVPAMHHAAIEERADRLTESKMSSFVNRAHRAGVVCLHASGSSYRQWSGLADRLTGRYAVYTPGLVRNNFV